MNSSLTRDPMNNMDSTLLSYNFSKDIQATLDNTMNKITSNKIISTDMFKCIPKIENVHDAIHISAVAQDLKKRKLAELYR